ncbi:MAG: bifunctional cytidylyltransferase/SDR family oxidoreductase [Simkaniaceae bacterium]|nr:bifunctional cytidylyltransferase/SDR family oxidoreductase [Simkaniaceae bacterium]
MYQGKRFGALILMGGTGTRFGSEMPKQFHNLSGKPIYKHTLETFEKSGIFDEILLVCPEKWLDHLDTPAIAGGKTRQASSYNGLKALKDVDYVMIHDAVRPLVTQEILLANADEVMRSGAVDTCIPATDTMVYTTTDTIESIPNRAHLKRGQTPQSFSYPLILQAHEQTEQTNATDDCTLAIEAGHKVTIVEGSETNIKITNTLDIYIAEQLYRLTPPPKTQATLTLKNKRFAVTGGSGEIGTAICQALTKAGATAIVLSRSTNTDLSNYDQALETFTNLGPLDGIINCTGYLTVGPLAELTQSEIETTLHSNLTSLIYACRLANIKEGGHIINLASSAYSRGRKNYAIYSGTKAAVVNFTQALALERPELQINTIAPSRTKSRMRALNFPGEDPSTLLTPDEISTEVLRLLQTPALTGSTIELKPNIAIKSQESL